MTTPLDKFFKGARTAGLNASSATDTAIAGGEMMQAAGDVIAARLEILAAGMVDPSKTDLKEIALMSSEKVEALSESAASMTRNMGALGERLSRSAADEMAIAGQAASAMATAPTAEAVARVHYDYMFGWWGRAASQMLTLNTEVLKAQAEALKPIHRTAMDNAQRLKR